MTTNTPDHVARAQAMQSDLAPLAEALAEVLKQYGMTITLETTHDRTLAAVLLCATFTGSPAQAHQLARFIESTARAQGVSLCGAVCDRFQDDLRPDQQRIGFVCFCPARKAAA